MYNRISTGTTLRQDTLTFERIHYKDKRSEVPSVTPKRTNRNERINGHKGSL